MATGTALWLAPTWRAAAEVRQRFFDGLSRLLPSGRDDLREIRRDVLHAAVPIRPVARLMKRELIRQIIDQQSARGRLTHFQSIATTGGLVDLVCEFISELKRLEIGRGVPSRLHGARHQ